MGYLPCKGLKLRPDDISLPIQEKAKILKNNIFGVDIDPQAVEITMLSLYLKAIEGERGALPMRQHLLPPLSNNIICGNSLVGYDMFEGQLFADETKDAVNPFDWNSKLAGFGEIMESGGFDVVIGNPPYIRIQTMDRAQVDYFNRNYVSAMGNYDIYVLFVEKALQLLKETSVHGFILPHKFFQASYGQGLRSVISKRNCMLEIVHFKDNQVFESVSTYTCLLFLSKKKFDKFKYVEINQLTNPAEQLETVIDKNEFLDESMKVGFVSKGQVTASPWSFHFDENAKVINRLKSKAQPLQSLTERIFQGLKTSADKIYILDVKDYKVDSVVAHSKELDKDVELESQLLKPLIKGGQMRRYLIEKHRKVVLFPYMNGQLIPKKEFQEKFPCCWAYLLENKKYLENREDGKMKGEKWYAFGRTQALEVIASKKIITPDIAPSAAYSLDTEGQYYFSGGAAGGYGIIPKADIDSLYLMALLNSSLIDWYHHQISTNFRGGYFSYESRFIKDIPIYTIDLANPSEKVIHDKIVSLVDRILELHKRKNDLPPSAERERIEREIAVTDETIDQLVFDLYQLSPAERMIIEAGKA